MRHLKDIPLHARMLPPACVAFPSFRRKILSDQDIKSQPHTPYTIRFVSKAEISLDGVVLLLRCSLNRKYLSFGLSVVCLQESEPVVGMWFQDRLTIYPSYNARLLLTCFLPAYDSKT
ncbi:hypothetical protein CDAR_587471 [Caerostris darwini]|uniref:Uncharacterized protein n=1 Tax=Caerostris darwini TaxID=1538125 RepID=A0AAV4SH90_9ARAC|nr:hypothetical protein CDAR_587471 [Caerostris darwini]